MDKSVARKNLEAMSCEDLDELVHEAKAEEAARINNSGHHVQVAYLIGDEIGEPVETNPQLKTYRICYRMECFVEAYDEDEAMEKYGDGEGDNREYVEFLSIEESRKEE